MPTGLPKKQAGSSLLKNEAIVCPSRLLSVSKIFVRDEEFLVRVNSMRTVALGSDRFASVS